MGTSRSAGFRTLGHTESNRAFRPTGFWRLWRSASVLRWWWRRRRRWWRRRRVRGRVGFRSWMEPRKVDGDSRSRGRHPRRTLRSRPRVHAASAASRAGAGPAPIRACRGRLWRERTARDQGSRFNLESRALVDSRNGALVDRVLPARECGLDDEVDSVGRLERPRHRTPEPARRAC